MRLGLLSTSWPSARRPWAGHFVADLATLLAPDLDTVVAVAPQWVADGGLLQRPGVQLVPAPVAGPARSPSADAVAGLRTLAALRLHAAEIEVDLWLCHWWPTALAAPQGTPRVAVLHGSDVDLLEGLPAPLRHRLAPRQAIAVAPALGQRYSQALGLPPVPVGAMGARRAQTGAAVPPWAAWWSESALPRVLTVARDAPGKGLEVARAAARRLPQVAWLIVTPELGAGPAEVRALIARAGLVVVPSLEGAGLPAEGRPHIIAQALVAGVPLLGGPNHAVRAALAEAGQPQLRASGAGPLSLAVRRALTQPRLRRSALAAARAGHVLSWEALAEPWHHLLRQALSRGSGAEAISCEGGAARHASESRRRTS